MLFKDQPHHWQTICGGLTVVTPGFLCRGRPYIVQGLTVVIASKAPKEFLIIISKESQFLGMAPKPLLVKPSYTHTETWFIFWKWH